MRNSDNLFVEFTKPKPIMEKLILAAGVGIALTSPAGSKFIARELYKYLSGQLEKENLKGKLDKKSLSRALYELKRRKLIKVERSGDSVKITLTEKGEGRRLEYDIERIAVQKPAKWDGKWRMIMFDIPEDKRVARDSFRDKLVRLGFLQFQKSIWLYPYNCADEIDFLAETFKIGPYLTALTVQIEEDEPLRKEFGL